MDQQRTITKIKSLRISVMFALILLLYGVVMSLFLEMNKEKINRNLRDKATQVLASKYENNMSSAVKVCDTAYGYFVKSQENAILLGITGLVSVLILIRLPISQRQKALSSLFITFGGLMLVMFYLSVGVLLPSAAKIEYVKSYMIWLYYPALGVYALGMLMFIFHAFRRIVAES